MLQDDESPGETSKAGLKKSPSTFIARNRANPSAKSLVPSHVRVSARNEAPSAFHDEAVLSSTSKTESRLRQTSREESENKYKLVSKALGKQGKVFSNPEFVVSDCWKASTEIPVKLIELFKDRNAEEDLGGPARRRYLSAEDESEKLSHTKEFHVLTEVQKARILSVVEDVVEKLANKDLSEYFSIAAQVPKPESPSFFSNEMNFEKYFCKKFLLPWVIMKVIETVICHIIQLTFLSNDFYFQKKHEFLPVIVTYYLTLFIVVISLLLHIGCYSYVGVRNPCYFMGVVTSSILTLTTSLGCFILLWSMKYYRSFREILVLVFIGILLGTLLAELCICYIEVKKFWSTMGQTNSCYIP